MTMVAPFLAGSFWHTHPADPLQINMHIGCMVVVKGDTCKIFGAYANLDCIISTVDDIGNRHSLQVTHYHKERILNLFPPQLKTDPWMIWQHKIKLLLSAKHSQFQRNGCQGRAVYQIWGHSFHNARNLSIWPVSSIQNWTRVTHWTPQDPTAA